MSAGVSLATIGSVVGIAGGINALTGGGITNALGMGPSQSAGAAGQQASMLSDPFQGSRGMYGQQLNQLMQGGPQAMQMLQNTPGYQFQMQQGLSALSSQSAATGYLGSGNTQKAMTDYASGLASQQYGNYFNQLAQLSGANWNSGPNAGNAIQQGQSMGNSQTMGGLSTLTSGLAGLQGVSNPFASPTYSGPTSGMNMPLSQTAITGGVDYNTYNAGMAGVGGSYAGYTGG